MTARQSNLLTRGEADELVEAAVHLDLANPRSRSVLISGLDPMIRAGLRVFDRPIDQLRSDIHELGSLPNLADPEEVPLVVWLQTALQMSADRPEAELFGKAIERVANRMQQAHVDSEPGVDPAAVLGTTPDSPPGGDRPSMPKYPDGLERLTLSGEPPGSGDSDNGGDSRRPGETPESPSSSGVDPQLDRLTREEVEHRLGRGEARFEAVDLSDLDLSMLDFTGARFDTVRGHGTKFSRASFDHTQARAVDFTRADFTGASFEGDADGGPVDWRGARLLDAEFKLARASGIELSEAVLTDARFVGADLTDAVLDRAKVAGTRFEAAILARARLRDIRPDHRTTFSDAIVNDCIIDKASLESLSDDYGGLQRCHRMVMRIEDPLAELRSSFSGFWAWFHLGALVAFVAPYALFIVRETLLQRTYDHEQIAAARQLLEGAQAWAVAQPELQPLVDVLGALNRLLIPTGEETSLLAGLGRFIWSGGEFDGFSFAAVSTFVLLLAYNISRGVLLWRTKTLEHQATVSGLPVRFTPDRKTRFMMAMARWGAIANLGLVAVHSIVFLVNTRIWL